MSFDADLTLLYKFDQTLSLAPVDPGLGPTLGIVRGSIANYRDSSGKFQTASSNVARFDHNGAGSPLGLLIEGVAENLCLESNTFETSPWFTSGEMTVTEGATVGPGGGVGFTLVDNEETLQTNLQQEFTISGNNWYCHSVYLKKDNNEDRMVEISVYCVNNTTQYNFTMFNTKTGAFALRTGLGVRDTRVDDAGDFWRVHVAIKNANSTTLKILMDPCAGSVLGTLDNSMNGEAIFSNSQLLNLGTGTAPLARVSSWILTTTSTVTRAKDVVSTTTMGWHDQAKGTFLVEFRSYKTESQDVMAAPLSSGDSTPMVTGIYTTAGNCVSWIRNNSGNVAFNTITDYDSDGTLNRMAATYANLDYQAYLNGIASAHDTTGSLSTAAPMGYFGVGNGIALGAFQGHIKEIRYYDVRKINTFLDDLSNGLIDESADAVIGLPLIQFIG